MPRIRSRAVGLALAGLTACVAPCGLAQGPAPAKAADADAQQKRLVRFSFTLQNTGAAPIDRATFSTFAPVRSTSYQRLESLSASLPAEVQADALGNQVLRVRLDPLPPYASRVVTIDAELVLTDKPRALPGSDAAAALFTRPERYIESDAPRIKEIARTLRADSPAATAQNTFAWVRRRLGRAGFTAEDRGALRALEDRAGDCTEHAYLFVALMRANGIPSRVLGGYLAAESGVLRPDDYHNWAEFYADGVWQLADPHQGNFARNARRYVATRVLSALVPGALGDTHRYAAAGPGLKVTMN